MNNADRKFIQGYACAVATHIRQHGDGVMAHEMMFASGCSMKDLINARVDEFDMEVLRTSEWAELARQKQEPPHA